MKNTILLRVFKLLARKVLALEICLVLDQRDFMIDLFSFSCSVAL